jgi:hypothetical protein
MNTHRRVHLLASLAFGVVLLSGLLLLLGGARRTARADAHDWFVTPTGTGDCSQAAPCGVQTALGVATDGDTIFLAAGTYTGSGGAVLTITHSITVVGGWDGSATTPPVCDADAYPTMWTARGRVAEPTSAAISPSPWRASP